MLLINVNRKACMGSQLMRLHLTLVTLNGQCQGYSDFGFRRLISREGAVRSCVTSVPIRHQ